MNLPEWFEKTIPLRFWDRFYIALGKVVCWICFHKRLKLSVSTYTYGTCRHTCMLYNVLPHEPFTFRCSFARYCLSWAVSKLEICMRDNQTDLVQQFTRTNNVRPMVYLLSEWPTRYGYWNNSDWLSLILFFPQRHNTNRCFAMCPWYLSWSIGSSLQLRPLLNWCLQFNNTICKSENTEFVKIAFIIRILIAKEVFIEWY